MATAKQNTAKAKPTTGSAAHTPRTAQEASIARQVEIGRQLTTEYAKAFKELAK